MKSLRAIAVALVIVSTALVAPSPASADGSGVWIIDTTDQNVSCYSDGNRPDLGPCKNHNIYAANWGYVCSGCDYVRLYWGTWYTGAYYCLPRMTYKDSVADSGLKFNRGSGGGLGQTIWNNVASVKWSGPC
jgi:hypothetical protein